MNFWKKKNLASRQIQSPQMCQEQSVRIRYIHNFQNEFHKVLHFHWLLPHKSENHSSNDTFFLFLNVPYCNIELHKRKEKNTVTIMHPKKRMRRIISQQPFIYYTKLYSLNLQLKKNIHSHQENLPPGYAPLNERIGVDACFGNFYYLIYHRFTPFSKYTTISVGYVASSVKSLMQNKTNWHKNCQMEIVILYSTNCRPYILEWLLITVDFLLHFFSFTLLSRKNSIDLHREFCIQSMRLPCKFLCHCELYITEAPIWIFISLCNLPPA